MKRWYSIILLVAVLHTTGCESRSQQAATYNDRLIEQQHYVLEAFNDLDSSLNDVDTTKIDEAYHILRGRIKESIREVEAMEDFKGDDSFRKATLDLMRGYDELVADPYSELIALMSLPDSAFKPSQQLQAFELEDEIIKGSKSLHQSYAKHQESFAERHNVFVE